jgi:hypothetical protein
MEFGTNVLEIGQWEISCVKSVSALFRPICATLISLFPSQQYFGFCQDGVRGPKGCEEFLQGQRTEK